MATLGVQLSWLPRRWHCMECSSTGGCDIGFGDEDDEDEDCDIGDDEDNGVGDVEDDEDEDEGVGFAINRWHIEHNCFSTFPISQL